MDNITIVVWLIALLMTRTQSTFFCNRTNPRLCNDWPFCPSRYRETERAIWLLHVLSLVTWRNVPLYCDVVIGGEEMKCLEAMWEMCVCVCVWVMKGHLEVQNWASIYDPVSLVLKSCKMFLSVLTEFGFVNLSIKSCPLLLETVSFFWFFLRKWQRNFS